MPEEKHPSVCGAGGRERGLADLLLLPLFLFFFLSHSLSYLAFILPRPFGTQSGLILSMSTCDGVSATTSAENEPGAVSVRRTFVYPPFFFFSPFFFSPPSCPIDQKRPHSHHLPESPPLRWPYRGLKCGGAFTAKFYDPAAVLHFNWRSVSAKDGGHSWMGGPKSFCALEVLTYRATDHMVVVVVGIVDLWSRSCLEMKPLSSPGLGLLSQPDIVSSLPVD